MRKSTTKKALFSSIVSLLLCVSMLLGSTFAWFTDSVTVANNQIIAGNLDVELYHSNRVDTEEKVEPDTALFDDVTLWEPGAVAFENLKVTNEGTLALKYNLAINFTDYNTVTENGKSLRDILKIALVEDAAVEKTGNEETDRENAIALGETVGFEAIDDFDFEGALMAENDTDDTDEKELALIIWWKPSSEDNDFNVNNDKTTSDAEALHINLGLTILATQENVEKDSFDENYDDIDIPEMDINTIDGVTYGTTKNGDYVMISVDDYTLTTFSVDEKVNVLGTGNGVNDNDRVFGKNAPLTSLELPEGLEEIKDNALNALPDLTTVNLPSTLKTIGIQSFRMTGMSTLAVPENVETVKQGAFRDMANLTTVTVEGNAAFDNYAFRSCPKLETIYLLGDDVTFEGNQFATHSDNGDATGITIYVMNSTVAARVYAAQTSAYGYEVKILGDEADGSDAADVTSAKDAAALQTALDDATDGDVIVLTGNISGDVVATQKPGVNVEINGAGKTISKPFVVDGKSATYTTAGLTIKNVNFVADSITEDACINLGDGTNATRYTCNVTIENCTFDVDGAVGIKSYTGGDKNLTVRNCTATARAHSLIQAKGIDGILIENCKVYSKNGLNFNNSDNVTVSECTVDTKGYAVRFGESSGGTGAAETYLIKDCTLKSACDDGDAVIVLRGTADNSTLTIENTTIDGAIEIANTATNATVIK